MTGFKPNLLPTGVGSLPFTDVEFAIKTVLDSTPQLPYWPQLTQLSFLENMYVQFAYNLPGISIDCTDKRIKLLRSKSEIYSDLEEFYKHYLDADLDYFKYDEKYFAGLYGILEHRTDLQNSIAIKGQLTGPVSLGLQLVDKENKPFLYDAELAEMVQKNLIMKARWQENFLKRICDTVIISIDEPSLGYIGSGYVTLPTDMIKKMLEELFNSLNCIKAIHCCSNTDWNFIFNLPLDIISFDAYNFFDGFFTAVRNIQPFIEKGGVIAWGIVPQAEESLDIETTVSLLKRFEKNCERLQSVGVDLDMLLSQSILTPACGLGSLQPEKALKALALLKNLSQELRTNYSLEK